MEGAGDWNLAPPTLTLDGDVLSNLESDWSGDLMLSSELPFSIGGNLAPLPFAEG